MGKHNFRLFEILQILPEVLTLPIILLPLIWQLGRVHIIHQILQSNGFQTYINVTIIAIFIVLLWEAILLIMQQLKISEVAPMLILHLFTVAFLLFAFSGGYAKFLLSLDKIVERLFL